MSVRLRSLLPLGLLVMAGPWLVPGAMGQTAAPSATPALSGSSMPMRLDLSRRDLKNFLTDKEALAPYSLAEGAVADLHDVFALGSVSAPWAIFWDSRSCRLLGILDLEAKPEPVTAPSAPASGEGTPDEDTPDSSPYLLKASGPFPLAKTAGASGTPRYFGFRLVKDVPEFLYTCGSLSIEERLWLDEGGKVLRQRFSVKDAAKGLQISVPEAWKGRVTSSAGTWKGAVLSVPKEAVAEVILTYPLAAPAEATSEPTTPDSN